MAEQRTCGTLVIRERMVDRESVMGAIIFVCIFVVMLSVASIRLLDVKISNIELVDRGLYTVITDKGPINISQDDILRIERSYTKAAITGTTVELDRIYTVKGFIYISSLDPFYKTAHQLINTVDFVGKPVWIRTDKSEATESVQNWNQLLNSNLKTVQPFSYAIGTPSKLVSLVFVTLSLQYLALSIGGIALVILIFPLKLGTPRTEKPLTVEDQDYSTSEEVIRVVAK